MAKAKWIFGNQNPVVPVVASKPIPIPVLKEADLKKIGLENFGNTCYANSVIQALYFCGPFRELLLQSPDYSLTANADVQSSPAPGQPRKLEGNTELSTDTNNGAANGLVKPIPPHPSTLFSALRSLFVTISTHPSDKDKVAPRAFIDKLKEFNDIFRGTMHQDAHEFQNYLLNKMIDELDEERKLLAAAQSEDVPTSNQTLGSQAPAAANYGSPSAATLVHKLFEGVLTSETRCLTCETVSSRDEPFLDLSIDIEENSSVTACLRQFSASEMLCQKNKFFCDSCCDLQEAEKRMKIKKLPNVLALHLKRFKYQEDVQKYVKLAYRVAFPFQLRLFNTVDDTEDADRLFDLYGIVVHIGTGPHHGHYVSIIKSLGVWLVFDDDNVYPITEAEIPKYFGDSNSGTAYVLYYQATDIDSAALGIQPAQSSVSGVGSEPGQASPAVVPVLPPGLSANEEGDSSDLSDPSYPITPSPPSPLLSVTKDQGIRVPALGLDIGPVPLTPGGEAVSTPTLQPKPSKPFFTLKRSPSNTARSSATSTGPPPLPTPTYNEHLTAEPESGDLHPPSEATTSTAASQLSSTNSRQQKEPEKKSGTWLFKRKSRNIPSESTPVSPVDSSSSSAGPTSIWSKATPSKHKIRRPSNGHVHAELLSNGLVSPSLTVPNGKDWQSHTASTVSEASPPESATSSTGSVQPPVHLSPGTHAPPVPSLSSMSDLHPRKESLPPIPLRTPDHKLSLSNLNLHPRREKKRSPIATRPSTAHAIVSDRHHELPPVPPMPATLTPNRRRATLGEDELPTVSNPKGKPRVGSEYYDPPPPTPPPAITFAASATSTSTHGSSNFKRATRKLSLSGPILGLSGFGKRDKKEKDGHGKGAPTAFSQMSHVNMPA